MLPQMLTMRLLLPFNFFKLSFFTKSALRLLFTVNKVTQHKDRAITAKSAHQRCQNTTVSLPFRVSAPAWWGNPLKADKLEKFWDQLENFSKYRPRVCCTLLGVQLQGANAANNWVMTGVPGVEMAKLWSHLQVNASNIAKCRAEEQGHSLR